MNSLILRTAARALQPVFLLYSMFLLIAGHDEPGGGFSGGLVAASAISLYAIAYDVDSARRIIPADPRTLIGVGLALALSSGLLSVFAGLPPMTGLWTTLPTPNGGSLAVGTPLLFDVGVYLLVIGVTLLKVLSLAEE
jgi:multicomponent Na+:H+ antiporter subunit B